MLKDLGPLSDQYPLLGRSGQKAEIYLAVWICLLLSLTGFSSCISLKQPTFQSIAAPKLMQVQGSKVTIESEVTLHNPNNRRLQLKGMKLGIFSGGEQLGQIFQDLEIPVEAQSDFSIPFQFSFDWAQSQKGLLSAALMALQDQQVKLQFRGYVKVGAKNKRGFKIPVIYTEKLKFR